MCFYSPSPEIHQGGMMDTFGAAARWGAANTANAATKRAKQKKTMEGGDNDDAHNYTPGSDEHGPWF